MLFCYPSSVGHNRKYNVSVSLHKTCSSFLPSVDRLVGSARPGLTSSGGNLPAAHVLAGLSKRYRPPGNHGNYILLRSCVVKQHYTHVVCMVCDVGSVLSQV